ncbi:lycopene beta epsilon cyclase protein isoform 2 [Nannochloropsis oceanica]
MQLLVIASITHAFFLPFPRRTLPTPQATTTPASTPTIITSEEAFGARTKRILDGIVADADASGGAGSSISFSTLQAIDRAWDAVKTGRAAREAPTFVRETDNLLPNTPQFDVVIAGGTLGIFMATALQKRGFKVCVVERGPLKGRTQEWNISRKEMMELVEEGVLSEEDVEAAIGIDFNPIRVGFVGENDEPYTLWTKDVLHLGVYPSVLLARAQARFLAAGGVVRENTPIKGVKIASNGAAIELEGEGMEDITGRLLIDCMGNQSPISRQSRAGQQPDGICIVVGTMASGFAPENNTYADLLYSNTPTLDKGKSQVHWFWEAFPASSGKEDRTTYLFMYCDAKPERPSILECFEDYWDLMPAYQNVDGGIDSLTFKRAVCNFFPTYKSSPLRTEFDRLCAIGDASGIQSPLSFGGFGSLSRHIRRLTLAFSDALLTDSLSKEELGLINAYQPSLSVTWMFQRAMSVPVGANPRPYFINRSLINNFKSMSKLGDPVLKPFLQDVVQAGPLFQAMAGIAKEDFFNTPTVLFHVGGDAFFGWFRHFFMLCVYTVLFNTLKGTKGWEGLSPKMRYRWDRQVENWEFGSGLDYTL